MVYWKIFGAWKKKQVRWRDLTWIWRHFNGHGQQPMKMHTEVTLLYNHFYLFLFFF